MIKRFQPYYRIMNLSFYRLLHHLIIPVSFSNLRGNRPSLPTMRFHKRDSRASNKKHLIVALENFNWTPIMRLNSCEHQQEAFQTVIDDAIDFYLPIVSVKNTPMTNRGSLPSLKTTSKSASKLG